MKDIDGLYKSDRHSALPQDSTPMRLYRIAFAKPLKRRKSRQDLIETEPAGGIYWPACKNGPCDGGRQPCPTTDACRRPDPTLMTERVRLFAEGKWANIAVAVALAIGAIAVAAILVAGQWPRYQF